MFYALSEFWKTKFSPYYFLELALSESSVESMYILGKIVNNEKSKYCHAVCVTEYMYIFDHSS